jgi:membrane protease YdiL (CAAX protease family)
MDMQRPADLRPLLEIVAMSGLLISYIWGWGSTFMGAFTLCVILYFTIGVASHLRAGEGPADLGIRIDNLGAAALDALVATLAIGLLLAGAGTLAGSLDFPPLPLWPRTLMDGVIWGLMQQYGLLCIFYRRFSELFPRHRDAPLWAASAIFALLHLPNPFLTVATLGAGALSCWLYRRRQNLLVLGVMHGLVSFLIVHTLTNGITMGMRVGPGFFRFMAGR